MEPIARQEKIATLALLAAICGLLPGRESSSVESDVEMAREYLEAATLAVDTEKESHAPQAG